MTGAKHGERGVCVTCNGRISYITYTQATGSGTYEILDAWWAHDSHPADDHDAQPSRGTYLQPVDDDRPFRNALDVLAAEPPRRRRWWRP